MGAILGILLLMAFRLPRELLSRVRASITTNMLAPCSKHRYGIRYFKKISNDIGHSDIGNSRHVNVNSNRPEPSAMH